MQNFRKLQVFIARSVCSVTVAALLLASLPLETRALEYSAHAPAPTGMVRIARPTIIWRVRPGAHTFVTRMSLTLNGKTVPAVYSPSERAVVYACVRPLAPGPHVVRCRVVFNDDWVVDRDWQFTVADDALEQLPVPNLEQQGALQVANGYRRVLALPPFQPDPRLCAAALAHAQYQQQNRVCSHQEQPGKPGFCGASVRERVGAFGYSAGCFESVEKGSDSLPLAVISLFDAPYHRLPFMQPGAPLFGAGRADLITTLEIGATEQGQTVFYPVDGQQDVPLSWDGRETPDPLRVHPDARAPVGYVITLFYFGAEQERLSNVEASLVTSSGRPVPFYLNTPDNDDFLQKGVLLVPQKPLEPGTTYRVCVRASTKTGKPAVIERRWSFTTKSPDERDVL